jgi:hypothetical protein
MKKLNSLYLLTILLSICFAGCNKDDDKNGDIEEAALIGTWEIVSERDYDKDVSTGVISNETQLDYTEVVRYVFKQDGSYEYRNEQTLIGTWNLDGKKLSTSFGGSALSKYEILNLDASELVLFRYLDRTTYWRCTEITFRRVLSDGK